MPRVIYHKMLTEHLAAAPVTTSFDVLSAVGVKLAVKFRSSAIFMIVRENNVVTKFIKP